MSEQVQRQVEKIEGISPEMLWTFLIVLVGLATLFLLGYKVIEVLRKEHERKVQRQQLDGQDITDQIANKVMEKLTPQIDEKFDSFESKFDKKLEDIDSKLATDKANIDSHTKQLNDHESRVGKLEGGNKALCQGMLALLKQSAATAKTEKAMENYLITGEYNKEDWQ